MLQKLFQKCRGQHIKRSRSGVEFYRKLFDDEIREIPVFKENSISSCEIRKDFELFASEQGDVLIAGNNSFIGIAESGNCDNSDLPAAYNCIHLIVIYESEGVQIGENGGER